MSMMISPIRAPRKRSSRPPNLPILIGIPILLVGLFLFALQTQRKPIVEGDDGKIELAPHRKAKMDKMLRDLGGAEQYALLATTPGLYECYHCPDTRWIFLKTGEVWKYGYTTKNTTRYTRKFYLSKGLEYFPQFTGTIEQCREQEIIKIFNYPSLPEALARPFILERPPGNKQDN